MTTTLQLDRFSSACTGGFRDSCFRICHQTLMYQQLTVHSANFGPSQQRISTASGECFCDSFMVHEANVEVSNGDTIATGSTLGGSPFKEVTMKRIASNQISIFWMSDDTTPFADGESCSATFTSISGPQVLVAAPGSFTSWWAIVVGVVIVLLLGSMLVYCGWYLRPSRNYGRRNGGTGGAAVGVRMSPSMMSSTVKTERRTPSAVQSPVVVDAIPSNPIPPAQSSVSSSESTQYDIPVATAVPIEADIETAIPVDQSGRQVAIV